MKKILALLLAATLVFSVGCKKDNQKDNSSSAADTSVTKTTAPRPVVEEDPNNMIKNAYLSNGDVANWNLFKQGGAGELKNENSELKVNVSYSGSVNYAVQIYQDGFKLDQGCKYIFKFDARSTIDRPIEARIQINGGDYHAYKLDSFNLTSEMKTYTMEFEMTESSDPAPRLAINLGTPKGADSYDVHDIYFDNFSLLLQDDSNKIQSTSKEVFKDINLDQLGYFPDSKKIAVFRGKAVDKTFDIVDAKTSKVVFSGKIDNKFVNSSAEETDYYGDFSSFKTAGTYKIKTATLGESYPFTISANVYDNAYASSLKMLYLQRCGTALPAKFAGDFAHPACHAEKATIFGTTTKIDVSGGWHDAGDYGRYVCPGAKTVADLILAYQSNPSSFGDNTGIPESSNKVPDILDEAKYELTWMLKMQDAKSGGVYHKVTCANFPGVVLPQDEKEPLIVSPISDAATGDFAAVMAMSYNTYKAYDKAFAEKCLAASKKAWTYINQKSILNGFKNPEGIVTGEYGDSGTLDEYLWASAELYKVTFDAKYQNIIKQKYDADYVGLGWADMAYYGVYAYLTTPQNKVDKTLYNSMKTNLIKDADEVLQLSKTDGYFISLGEKYPWGSNMTVTNNAMLLQFANKFAPKQEYADAAAAHVHYLFGTNPMSICYLTGFGTVSPVSTHHRPSQKLQKTMAGMLVGGPDSSLEDPYAKAVLADRAPAMCYVDNSQSFSCNEITIYWNSPLIYVMTNL